jgi:hypothetical protein
MSSSGLVASIINAHGGLPAYQSLNTISFTFSFTGATLGMKGRPQHVTPTATTFVQEQKTIYRGLGGSSDEEWIFTPNKVWKQRVSDGSIIEEREKPRAAFDGHTLETPWDDLHFLYFCGYAMYQYFHWPFLLAREDVTTTELEPHTEGSLKWRVLEVSYPEYPTLATHARKQKYYVDSESFLLRRHDYAPDVLAGANAAHFSFDPIKVGDFTWPSLRHIVAIGEDGPMMFGPIPTLIHLVILRIAVEGKDGKKEVWSVE